MPAPAALAPMPEPESFDRIYAAHVGFVWRVLRALGVGDAQLEDACQDVFVVVHRKLAEFEHRAQITTWLFAIARRIASSYRRRGRDDQRAPLDDQLASDDDPFGDFSQAEAARRVNALLAQLDEDKRLVFALVELEQLAVPEVARMLEIPLNTAYSRLRRAREAFERAARKAGAR